MRLFRLVSVLVLAAIVVLPVSMALADEYNAYPTRTLPATVEREGTFNVTVTFTAPADNFHEISLTDLAPAGWNVTVDKTWCQPKPAPCRAIGNETDFAWMMVNYTEGVNFTVLYKVTVPCGASLGNYTFSGFLGYYVGYSGHIFEDVTGDFNVTVVRPAICFAPASIDFYAAVNGTNPQNQTLDLFSSTPCMLNWSLTDDADWLSENQTSGNCTDEHISVALSVNASGMSEGDYPANITIQSPGANNSPRIVPVTLHMRETSILEAHVSFVGRGDPGSDKWIEPFEVWLFNSGTTDVVWQGVRTTNNTGWFNISDVVVGIYDIAIKNATCLSEVRPVTVSEGAGAVVDFGTLREGDSNNDDYITISDRTLLYGGWGTGESDPGWNANCDFNRDGYLTISDRTMVYDNWGQCGDLVGY